MSFETLDEAPAQPQIRCIQLVQDSITLESSNVATTPLASPYPCVIIAPTSEAALHSLPSTSTNKILPDLRPYPTTQCRLNSLIT